MTGRRVMTDALTTPALCRAENNGLSCDLPVGHGGKHAQAMGWDDEGRVDEGWDDEGRVDDGVSLADVPVALDVVALPAGTDNLPDDLRALLHRSVPIATVADLYDDVEAFIGSIEQQLAPAKSRRADLHAILEARMRDQKATVLAHPSFDEIEIRPGEKITERRIGVLRELFDLEHEDGSPLIPAEVLAKAIWTETPAPIIKTHLTFLGKLGKYGRRVQDILAKGIVESRGPDRLVIRRRKPEPRNVTGSATPTAVS